MSQDKGQAVALKKVVLFNSGVGYFEHKGAVKGNASVELRFNVDDINDLLKSMVLQDLDGGKISTVTYGSRDPITKALKTFSIDLTSNPTLADLLSQIRGETVEIEAPNKITGTILGVEKRKKLVGDKDVIEIEVLNLLTPGGLKSVPLDQVGSIKLTSEKLNAELQQALAVLASGATNDKKTVTLNFTGEGDRQVRVGYIQETPVWKTSYRLILGDDEEGPKLQGWAIVENTTEEDWNDVRLSLMSGRPISFRMDLYQPLYVGRPLVVPELYASLAPRTYDQDLDGADKDFKGAAVAAAAPPAPGAALAADGRQLQRRGAKQDALAEKAATFGNRAREEADRANFAQGVQSVAEAANVGELFEYQIEEPVTLQRQRSAMLPIVNSAVKGEKVSIYNQTVHAKHPLNGLKFTNSTDLHLMQGPITVFDGGAYAGDARIEDLPPKTERLLSYAMDLDTEVAPQSKGTPDQLLSVRIVKGTLYASRKYVKTMSYTVKNSGKKAKKVLIEQPLDPSWTLVSPKTPAEKTRDLYRFAVDAEPGKPATLDVVEEMTQTQGVALTSIDDGTIRIYLSAPVVSEQVKKALEEVIARKTKIGQVAAEKQKLQQGIAVIAEEQNRIRQNMAQLDRNTDLYKKYVQKFTEQEDLNDKLRKDIEKLAAEEAKLRKELDDYLIGLELT